MRLGVGGVEMSLYSGGLTVSSNREPERGFRAPSMESGERSSIPSSYK